MADPTIVSEGDELTPSNVNSWLHEAGGSFVNVASYGATGDGSTDDATAISNADTAASGKLLVFSPGTYSIASTLSITSPIFLPKGAILKPASGTTLTISSVDCGSYQIFDVSAGGTVSISAPQNDVYVQWWGATCDGTTNDASAISSAIAAVGAAGGGIVYFPAGTYNIATQITISVDNVVCRGAGPEVSIIKRGGNIVPISTDLNEVCENLVFEGLTFDGNRPTQNGSTAVLQLLETRRTRIRNCAFINPTNATLAIQRSNDVLVEDCTFRGATDATTAGGRGIDVQYSCYDLRIERCRFHYLHDSIVVDGDNGSVRHMAVRDCYADGGWWTLPAHFTGSGGTVTYASNGLTDTGASFSGIETLTCVRAMATLESGSFNTVNGTRVVDTSATFQTNTVGVGDILVSGSIFGLISEVISETEVRVEEWLDNTSRDWVEGPDNGSSYTVYNVVFGQISSSTGTTLTINRWYDWDGGDATTPSAGTLYELSSYKPNYFLLLEDPGAEDIEISGNVLVRHYADSMNLRGQGVRVINNTVRDDQDIGINVQGEGAIVSGNFVHHNATYGIWVDGNANVVTGNTCLDNGWYYVGSGSATWSGITLGANSTNTICANNTVTAPNMDRGYGIVDRGTGNVIRNNYVSGVTGDIHVYEGTQSKVFDNIAGVVTGAGGALHMPSLANDATPSIQGYNLWKTGGTTTITDFDDGYVGQTITILAQHSVTITHNASIINLNGAANFAMASGDTLTLTMFNDQVWHEVGRSDNTP